MKACIAEQYRNRKARECRYGREGAAQAALGRAILQDRARVMGRYLEKEMQARFTTGRCPGCKNANPPTQRVIAPKAGLCLLEAITQILVQLARYDADKRGWAASISSDLKIAPRAAGIP